MKNVATCSRKRAGSRRRFALLTAFLARKPRIEMQPAIGRHRRTNVGFQHAYISRTDVHVSYHALLREERAGRTFRMRNSQSYSLTRSHPPTREKATSWNAPPQNNPTMNLCVTSGLAKPSPPTDIGERIKSHSSRAIRVLEGGRWAHPPPTGGDGPTP